MKPTELWLGRLAMAGACLVWAGCGGGGDSDSADDAAPALVDGGSGAAASPEPPPEPTAAAAVSPTPAPTSEAPTPAPESVATATAEATPTADSSGTEEMLRMATNSSPSAATGGSEAPAPAAAATPGGEREGDRSIQPGPGAVSSPAPIDGPSPVAINSPAPVGGPAPKPSPGPAGDSGFGATMTSNEGVAGPGAPGAPAGPGPSFASPGGDSSGGTSTSPNAFRTANGAVKAFLDALKAKNKDRLAEATARRAATESVEKHRKIFAAILEQSISDEELDDMAKTLEGYQVMTVLPAKSTGQIGVVISKMEGRDNLQRTVQVRHEKEGWKVQDLGNAIDFKPMGTYRNPNARRKR